MKKVLLILAALCALVACNKEKTDTPYTVPAFEGAPLEGPFIDLTCVPDGSSVATIKDIIGKKYPSATVEYEYSYSILFSIGETSIYFDLVDGASDWCSVSYRQKDLGMKEIVDRLTALYGEAEVEADPFFPKRSRWNFGSSVYENITAYYAFSLIDEPDNYNIEVQFDNFSSLGD